MTSYADRVRRIILAGTLVLAACGGNGEQADTTTTTTTTTTTEATATTVETRTVTVRVTGEVLFSGCAQAMDRSDLDIGNGARVTLEDGTGETLGVGTFQPTDGAESCDWSATIPGVPSDRDFYRATAGNEVITMDRRDMGRRSWRMVVHVDSLGNVR